MTIPASTSCAPAGRPAHPSRAGQLGLVENGSAPILLRRAWPIRGRWPAAADRDPDPRTYFRILNHSCARGRRRGVADRGIVDPEDGHRRTLGHRPRADHLDERVATARHTKTLAGRAPARPASASAIGTNASLHVITPEPNCVSTDTPPSTVHAVACRSPWNVRTDDRRSEVVQPLLADVCELCGKRACAVRRGPSEKDQLSRHLVGGLPYVTHGSVGAQG